MKFYTRCHHGVSMVQQQITEMESPESSRDNWQLTKKIIMRINLTALIIALAFINVWASVNGQVISLKANNMPIEKFFDAIKAQSGYGFWYEKNNVRNITISVNADQKNLRDLLDTYLPDKNLDYKIVDRTIFIKKKDQSVLEKIGNLFKDIIISGKVLDETGLPLIGASVSLKGTNKSVATDKNGFFSLEVPETGAVLSIRYIGYENYEYKVTGTTDITVTMKQATSTLQEVGVVSDGYQTISKERATGSYGVISAKDLKEVQSNNILERLEGKIPGVRVDVRNNNIQIRSLNTYTNNTPPLIVVDGFPMINTGDNQGLTKVQNSTLANGSVLSNFNPEDIEQITFLKDAVATSIWGSKAANGVIVITTKRGKKGAPVINLSSIFSTSKPVSFSDLNWMTSAQYADLETEMVNKNFIRDAAASLNTKNPSEVQEWLFKVKRGTATQDQANQAIAEISSRDNADQITKYLLQNAITQQQNLSISGGGEDNTYYIAANYNKDRPVYKGNSANNTIVTANFTNSFFKNRVTLNTGINYQYAKTQINQAATDALGLTTTSLRPYDLLVDGNGNHILRNIQFRPEFETTQVAKGYLPSTYNAIDELNYSNTKGSSNQFRFNTGLNVKIVKWLEANVSGSYQRNINNTLSINEANSYIGRTTINTYTTISPTTNRPVYNLPYGGIYTLSDANSYVYNLRGQLNMNKNFGSDHTVTALIGSEISEAYSKSYSNTQYGYDGDSNTFGLVDAKTQYPTMYGYSQNIPNPNSGVSEQKTRNLSYYGNVAYSYRGKYDFSASARFDDYTQVGLQRSQRAKPFWSAGVKWVAKQEDFLQNVNWLNRANLRLTYGTAGRSPVGGSNQSIITVTATDPTTQQPIATIITPGDQQLGWETTKTINLGTDISVLDNRLSATFDIYDKRSNGILANLPYNPTYGWSFLQFNTGKMKSNGYEFSVSGKIADHQDWSINSTFNFSYSKNKVTDNRYNTTLGTTIAQGGTTLDGYPVGATFVYRSAGLDPTTGQTQIYDRNNNIIKNTTNLTSAFTIEDLKYVGVKAAPYFGGFMNTFRYKSLELGVQTSFYFGHVFLKPTITNYPTAASYSGVIGKQEDLAYRWRQTGDESFTNVPGLTGVNNNSIIRYRYSDDLVRSADNIRLQQISLNYRVPQSLLPKNVFKSLSVGASARNLGMIWVKNKEKLDPEYLNANANYYSMPPTKTFLFSINASF
ncbi:TonB-linked outer membrane protein, SusC/RagA family [Pedobacter sp. ok626]|uniref:SusC/RagA family TonB-linked outer membrane protein n=1 Tax=Pedobacter sp. ok626 TaxID=1761882 RepID=UPI00088E3E42|nr:SusC/RagA family TonB-linked outer membrane protein [Pedobacter sp. ok626]SDL65035.1 TonB-linked outer membrane protein, SusC/RagA family [Pedobacter sp. ok626]